AGTGFNDPRAGIIPGFSEALADWPQAVAGFNDRRPVIVPGFPAVTGYDQKAVAATVFNDRRPVIVPGGLTSPDRL
ncbi:hypothetical protein, partial [Micromonospora sp. NPDC005367]|uniref:hypothetical protein n=1 Tax=Micromonospora sp. NPDC005367 TaxID=3155590 RepID=UPI0033A76CF0